MMRLGLLLLLCIPMTSSHRLMGSLFKHHTPQPNTWKTLWATQKLDHFAFSQAGSDYSYQQRLLLNTDNWKPGGPIFFYTGNEGDIEIFAENSGLLFDLAPEFEAAVVFAEHRYYGKSLPFGNHTFDDWATTRWLSVEQAMADFADNIVWLRQNLFGNDTAVITFGGSYGGMLAGWMRAKYPSLVQGAIAASAPVWMFPGMAKDTTGPYKIITKVFRDQAAECPEKVAKSWPLIVELGTTRAGRARLTSLFHLCKPLESEKVPLLSQWLNEMYFDIAMVNYPYPTSFLAPLPAWPVREFCRRANRTSDVISAIAAGAQVYSNYTGTVKCLDLESAPDGAFAMQGWGFQACNEIILPMSSDRAKDMFPAYSWDLDLFTKSCAAQWNTTSRPYWLKYYFGGMDGYDFSGYSNIFFSNGALDPWSAGGTCLIQDKFCLSDCPNDLIPEGAHHLDLRSANPADPQSVIRTRQQEVEAIRRWTKRNGRIEL